MGSHYPIQVTCYDVLVIPLKLQQQIMSKVPLFAFDLGKCHGRYKPWRFEREIPTIYFPVLNNNYCILTVPGSHLKNPLMFQLVEANGS